MRSFPEHLRGHFERPEHVGEPAGGADLRGEARNAACGDHVRVYVQCEAGPEAGAARVRAAGFRAQGCPAAMATASAACGVLEGLIADASLPEALARAFEERFGAPRPAHRHALALFAEALRAAQPVTPRGSGDSPRDGR